MGASGWEYMVPYQADLAAALNALRRQVFEQGNYVSPIDHGLAAPDSVEALWEQDYYWEFMGTCGTHSIIDVARVISPGETEQEIGTIRPLADAEYRELFGTATPAYSGYQRVSNSARFYGYVKGGRGTGRAAVLWTGGHPSSIVFWGYSGD